MSGWGRASLRIGGMVLLGLGAILALCFALGHSPTVTTAQGPISAAASGDPSTGLVLSEVHIGLTGFGGKDEAFRITNVSTRSLVLTDTWGVRDDNGDSVWFPSTGITLPAGASTWCARNALSFTLAFGFTPTLEYGVDSTPAVPDMSLNSGFAFANTGGSATLFRVALVDTANGDGGGWPAGTNLPDATMERVDPSVADTDGNWQTSVSDTIGLDRNSNPLTGTPRYANSVVNDSGSSDPPFVVINEVAWSGSAGSDWDEWIELYNNITRSIDLDGWLLEAADGDPSITLGGIIPAGGYLLLERDDQAVNNISADLIYGGNRMSNSGERLYLYQAFAVDTVVYGDADPSRLGWSGPALRQYSSSGVSASGQILFRKRDESTGLLVADTNTAADWANDTTAGAVLYGPVHEGDLYGKRALYPGWDWDAYTDTFAIAATARLTVGIAPDNVYTVVADLLRGAQKSVVVEGYTFGSVWLAGVLTERLAAGVQVTVLLEGGRISDQELWISKQISDAGGLVYFMHNDSSADIHDRYTNQHAKFIVVDGAWVAIGSENLGNHAFPVDDKANGTAGNRGIFLITDQEDVVRYVESLFARDCDPVNHQDVVTYGQVDRYVVPPTYTAVYSPGGGGYDYVAPFSVAMPAFTAEHFEVVHAPETGLRYSDGLIGLVLRAGAGDEVYVEQMYERLHWGPSSSGVLTDPNPRLEAYIQAARNGATVRILLDKGFDDRRENYETAFYVLSVAQSEGLDLEVRLGNPTRRGIHNKMVLVNLGGQKTIHVGSINGSEASSKVNRELALQVRSADAYDYIKGVFDYDWTHSGGPYETFFPLTSRSYVPESDHVLISEVMFKQAGSGEEFGEWIELYNPTDQAVNVGGWYLGDAVHAVDYERLYAFPLGTTIPAGGTLVIARRAVAYQAIGYVGKPVPDFEWNDSNGVPDMIASSWGDGEFAMGNTGDQVLLLTSALQSVDVLVYGPDTFGGVVSFGDVSGVYNGNSLERWPANRDANDCRHDFRVRYDPDPGNVEAW